MLITDIWPDVTTNTVAPKFARVHHVRDHLLLPFGRAVKSDLQKIGLIAVSSDGLYLSTDVPVISIRKSDHKPLCLGEFDKHFGNFPDDVPYNDDAAILNYICDAIKSNNPDMTPSEELFLDLYFGTLMALHQKDFKKYKETCDQIGANWISLKRHKTPKDVWRALLPIPEMQIYVQDPLSATKSYQPNNNFRVDYGFWDGTRLIAVEIDGAEPSGYARDIRRDRLLRGAGVDVIHILNVELAKYKGRALQELIPCKFLATIGITKESDRILFRFNRASRRSLRNPIRGFGQAAITTFIRSLRQPSRSNATH